MFAFALASILYTFLVRAEIKPNYVPMWSVSIAVALAMTTFAVLHAKDEKKHEEPTLSEASGEAEEEEAEVVDEGGGGGSGGGPGRKRISTDSKTRE